MFHSRLYSHCFGLGCWSRRSGPAWLQGIYSLSPFLPFHQPWVLLLAELHSFWLPLLIYVYKIRILWWFWSLETFISCFAEACWSCLSYHALGRAAWIVAHALHGSACSTNTMSEPLGAHNVLRRLKEPKSRATKCYPFFTGRGCQRREPSTVQPCYGNVPMPMPHPNGLATTWINLVWSQTVPTPYWAAKCFGDWRRLRRVWCEYVWMPKESTAQNMIKEYKRCSKTLNV